MVAPPIDDKSSDTLVAGLRLMVLDGEFNSPPSPPEAHPDAPSANGAFFVGRASRPSRRVADGGRRLRRSGGRAPRQHRSRFLRAERALPSAREPPSSREP